MKGGFFMACANNKCIYVPLPYFYIILYLCIGDFISSNCYPLTAFILQLSIWRQEINLREIKGSFQL